LQIRDLFLEQLVFSAQRGSGLGIGAQGRHASLEGFFLPGQRLRQAGLFGELAVGLFEGLPRGFQLSRIDRLGGQAVEFALQGGFFGRQRLGQAGLFGELAVGLFKRLAGFVQCLRVRGRNRLVFLLGQAHLEQVILFLQVADLRLRPGQFARVHGRGLNGQRFFEFRLEHGFVGLQPAHLVLKRAELMLPVARRRR